MMNTRHRLSYVPLPYAAKYGEAQEFLERAGLYRLLAPFDPVLAGTIPLGIETPDSDLDILCEVADHDAFSHRVHQSFSSYPEFSLYSAAACDPPATVCTFLCGPWRVELFGQSQPVQRQNAFRHMIAEARLLLMAGEPAVTALRSLKLGGLPTEAAFGMYFGIPGDPYQSLLELYTASDELLRAVALRKRGV